MWFKIFLILWTIHWNPFKCSLVIDRAVQEGIYLDEYCPKMPFCPEGAHVMCMYYNPQRVYGPRCSSFQNISVTPEVAEHLLGMVNEIRGRVAMGIETGKGNVSLPRGYGMFQLKWDNELATFAQVLANTCILRRDLCRASKKFPDPGQVASLVRFTIPDWLPVSHQMNFKEKGLTNSKIFYATNEATKTWFRDKQHVTLEMLQEGPDWLTAKSSEGRLYMHMIDGKATHMGCGVSAYVEYKFNGNNPQQIIFNSVQIICNLSSQPRKGTPVYRKQKLSAEELCPAGDRRCVSRYNSKCGCPPDTAEDDRCLCTDPIPVQTVRSCGKDKNCKPAVVLLPIFTVEDAPQHMISRKAGLEDDEMIPVHNERPAVSNEWEHNEVVQKYRRRSQLEFDKISIGSTYDSTPSCDHKQEPVDDFEKSSYIMNSIEPPYTKSRVPNRKEPALDENQDNYWNKQKFRKSLNEKNDNLRYQQSHKDSFDEIRDHLQSQSTRRELFNGERNPIHNQPYRQKYLNDKHDEMQNQPNNQNYYNDEPDNRKAHLNPKNFIGDKDKLSQSQFNQQESLHETLDNNGNHHFSNEHFHNKYEDILLEPHQENIYDKENINIANIPKPRKLSERKRDNTLNQNRRNYHNEKDENTYNRSNRKKYFDKNHDKQNQPNHEKSIEYKDENIQNHSDQQGYFHEQQYDIRNQPSRNEYSDDKYKSVQNKPNQRDTNEEIGNILSHINNREISNEDHDDKTQNQQLRQESIDEKYAHHPNHKIQTNIFDQTRKTIPNQLVQKQNKKNIFLQDQPEQTKKNIGPNRRRSAFAKNRQSIFSRAPRFELNKQAKYSGKMDVAPRKDFSDAKQALDKYLNEKRQKDGYVQNTSSNVETVDDIKPDTIPTEPIPTTSIKPIEKLKTSVISSRNYNNILFDRNVTKTSTKRPSKYLKNKFRNSVSDMNDEALNQVEDSSDIKESDRKLMNILNKLEKEAQHVDLNGNEKEIFDAKLKKIYGSIAKKTGFDVPKSNKMEFSDEEFVNIKGKKWRNKNVGYDFSDDDVMFSDNTDDPRKDEFDKQMYDAEDSITDFKSKDHDISLHSLYARPLPRDQNNLRSVSEDKNMDFNIFRNTFNDVDSFHNKLSTKDLKHNNRHSNSKYLEDMRRDDEVKSLPYKVQYGKIHKRPKYNKFNKYEEKQKVYRQDYDRHLNKIDKQRLRYEDDITSDYDDDKPIHFDSKNDKPYGKEYEKDYPEDPLSAERRRFYQEKIDKLKRRKISDTNDYNLESGRRYRHLRGLRRSSGGNSRRYYLPNRKSRHNF